MNAAGPFRIEDYFDGRVQAEGLVEDRFGRVRRKFSVTIEGRSDDGAFVLDERFRFDDGEESTRIWRVRQVAPGKYEGEAADVVGKARGSSSGEQLSWRYRLRLPIGSKVWSIDFDDRMYLRPDGVMLNIATMRKWGVTLGRITIAFRRPAS